MSPVFVIVFDPTPPALIVLAPEDRVVSSESMPEVTGVFSDDFSGVDRESSPPAPLVVKARDAVDLPLAGR